MEKLTIDLMGFRFTLEALAQPRTDAEAAIAAEIQERWARAVQQVVQPWEEPAGPRLIYSAPGDQAPLDAPGPTGPFPK